MTDYYTLLAKAVSNFPKGGPAAPRKAIYDRARAALVRQLRALGPSLSESAVAREQSSLESAIARLEAQFAPAAPTYRSAEPFARTPSPSTPAPAPSAPLRQAAARPAPLPAAPARPAAPQPTAPAGGGAHRSPIGAEPSPKPTLGARATPAAPRFSAPAPPPAALRGAPPSSPAASRFSPTMPPIAAPRSAPPSSPAAPRYSPPAPPPAAHAAVEPSTAAPDADEVDAELDAEGYAPPVDAAADVDRVAYAPAATDRETIRPSAPSGVDAPRANPLPWILLAVVVGVVFSVAVAAFLLRQKPQDLGIKELPGAADAQSPASPAKIVERVGGAPAAPAAAPSVEAKPAPTQAPTAVASAAQPAASPAAPPGAARAAMLVAVASDQQKPPAVSLGTVVWSSIPAAAGQPATVGVKADADIPDLKMHAVMTVRKNTDPNLPASHTIDVRVTFADGAEIKGVKDMRVPMMRREDPAAQDPLAGVRVKISDSYFLIGLNRTDADAAHNIDLIGSRGWFDFPMLLSDDRIAKLTFEKGADGERILSDALAAWKGP